MSISTQITALHEKVRKHEQRYQRQPNSVKVIAVSKKQPIANIQAAIHAGQCDFAESYVQEALPKISFLKGNPLTWHFIGAIQSKKTKKIATHFDWVHSVSSIDIANNLSTHRPINCPPLQICLQINSSHEATKSGLAYDEVLSLAQHCLTLPNLTLRGLMAIPRPQSHWIDQRAECYKLRLMYDFLCSKNIPLDTLSLGMSHDMEAAIAEGSTMIRIGTFIFGKRD